MITAKGWCVWTGNAFKQGGMADRLSSWIITIFQGNETWTYLYSISTTPEPHLQLLTPHPDTYSGSFLPVTPASLTGCLGLWALKPQLFIPTHASALWPVASSLAFLWLSFPIHKVMITVLTPLGCCKRCEYPTLGKAHSTSLTQRKYPGIYSSRVPHFLLMLPPENLPHLFPLQFLLNPINLIPSLFSTLL